MRVPGVARRCRLPGKIKYLSILPVPPLWRGGNSCVGLAAFALGSIVVCNMFHVKFMLTPRYSFTFFMRIFTLHVVYFSFLSYCPFPLLRSLPSSEFLRLPYTPYLTPCLCGVLFYIPSPVRPRPYGLQRRCSLIICPAPVPPRPSWSVPRILYFEFGTGSLKIFQRHYVRTII